MKCVIEVPDILCRIQIDVRKIRIPFHFSHGIVRMHRVKGHGMRSICAMQNMHTNICQSGLGRAFEVTSFNR